MRSVQSYLWLVYPLLVVGFIVISSQYLFDATRWASLTEDGEKVKVQEEQIAQLRRKLSVLSNVDLVQDEASLKYLVSAVPNAKMVWYLVSELKLAASDGAVVVQEYKGEVGVGVTEASQAATMRVNTGNKLILKTTLRVKNMEDFKNFLASLHSRLPLVRVIKVEYLSGEVNLSLEGAWSPFKSSVGDTSELPDYKLRVEKAKAGLVGLVGFPEVVISKSGTPSGETIVNPF